MHDDNCFALGGACGHAGLFGTADGVLDFASGILSRESFSPAILSQMETVVAGHRTCGWERKFTNWSGGERCSERTIGHTGFTGTGMWIDLEREIGWTLLTNRVHPTRQKGREIVPLRRECSNALIEAWDAP